MENNNDKKEELEKLLLENPILINETIIKINKIDEEFEEYEFFENDVDVVAELFLNVIDLYEAIIYGNFNKEHKYFYVNSRGYIQNVSDITDVYEIQSECVVSLCNYIICCFECDEDEDFRFSDQIIRLLN